MTEPNFRPLNPPLRLMAAFSQAFPACSPEWIIRAPGRDVWLAAAASRGEQFTVVAADLEARAAFSLRSAKNRRTLAQRTLPRWVWYPAGVLLLAYQAGLDVIGAQVVVVSEEPPGPQGEYGLGLTFAALAYEQAAQPYTLEKLMDLVERVRREYVEA